ncbi:MAG: succinylglutamate desuccinylase/aspartoacylase family protein [Methanobrevibacter sp.]|jgi:predicted deacylase|nr:succinylglutamate desuccinylase/aspartoacylase family protein [Candidatus Methanoflexus mossambicus]
MSKKPLDFNYISYKTGGNLRENRVLAAYFPNTPIINWIIEKSKNGTGIYKFTNLDSKDNDENGDYRVAILSGVHGNELPPQIATLHLINKLNFSNMNGTVYVIPFFSPNSTMRNSRYFDGLDLNRYCDIPGNIGYDLIAILKDLKIDAVGDFHSTGPNANPGYESVMSSNRPSKLSAEIGEYISKFVGSRWIQYEMAGQAFKGAIEDELNLNGIPTVTCEVLAYEKHITNIAWQQSLLQMKYFLRFFNII